MECAAQATGSTRAIMFPLKGRLPSLPMSRSMEASADTYFREGWYLRDERYQAQPILARKGVATDLDFMTIDAMGSHPYYQDFLGRHGLRWFAGIRVGRGEDEWCLSLQRKTDQEPFSVEDQRKFEALSVRIAGTVELARAFGFARVEAALGAFEVSGTAVVLFDRHARVLRVNEAARRVLGPDLQISRGRLSSWKGSASAALDRALASLLWSQGASHQTPPVVLPRLSGRPIIAYPILLSGVSSDILSPCRAAVVLVDLERQGTCPAKTLQSCFALTAAEARLASVVATGIPIDMAANELGVSYETALPVEGGLRQDRHPSPDGTGEPAGSVPPRPTICRHHITQLGDAPPFR
jgi:PAS domain-containing protein